MSEETTRPDPDATPAAPAEGRPSQPPPHAETPPSRPASQPANASPDAASDVPPDQPPKQKPGEIGGPQGPEPTRYGDWEVGGRCTDF